MSGTIEKINPVEMLKIGGITDDQLRRAYLVQPDRLESLRLTSKCRSIVNFVYSNNGATAPDIVAQYGCSIQSASGFLSRLYQQGYLTRRDVGAPSGGSMYEYDVPIFLSAALKNSGDKK